MSDRSPEPRGASDDQGDPKPTDVPLSPEQPGEDKEKAAPGLDPDAPIQPWGHGGGEATVIQPAKEN
jgi:hypothetical protein